MKMKKTTCLSTGEIAYNYKQYLLTRHWAAIRFDLRDEKCFICNRKGAQVHHVNYDRLGQEEPEDLVVLCGLHHMELHGKKPKKKVVRVKRKKLTKIEKLKAKNSKLPYKTKEENGIQIKVYGIRARI